MKLYLYFSLGLASIIGVNVFLALRDTQLFRVYDQRNAEICRALEYTDQGKCIK